MRCRNQVVICIIGAPLWMATKMGFTVCYHCKCNITVNLTLLFPFRNSSLKPMKDLRRLALIPRGGSMVIFELFWSTGTGNLGLGMLVSHRRKSRCTCVCVCVCAMYVHVLICKCGVCVGVCVVCVSVWCVCVWCVACALVCVCGVCIDV